MSKVEKNEKNEKTRRVLLTLLRARPSSVADLARETGLTVNAVRFHLESLELEGLVEPAGMRRPAGPGKPPILVRGNRPRRPRTFQSVRADALGCRRGGAARGAGKSDRAILPSSGRAHGRGFARVARLPVKKGDGRLQPSQRSGRLHHGDAEWRRIQDSGTRLPAGRGGRSGAVCLLGGRVADREGRWGAGHAVL